MSGKVILVGAGPGDPNLITLKGKLALEQADVVLYDHLAHCNLLHYCRSDCKRVDVGKKKGQHSKKQGQINRLMKTHAAKGCLVVRLKGGDPTIFGRAGEEMEYLAAHKIPFEIVPGVSSAIAVPTFAGIPLTHRKLSRSVAFVTGTLSSGQRLEDMHFPEADTLVFLMAITHLKELAARLISMRRFSKSTPAALIYKGTTADQKTIVSTLAKIESDRAAAGLTPPAILVVGKVAKLAQTLDWTAKLPLFGKRVIVLRTMAQSESVAQELARLGAEVVQFPVLDIRPLSAGRRRITAAFLNRFSTLILTSPNGVAQFMSALLENGADSRNLAGKRLVVIGPKTAEKLREFGLNPDVVSEKSNQEGLVDVLAKSAKGQSILIPTAQDARSALATGLTQNGATVTQVALYQSVCPKLPGLTVHQNDIVLFTSASTVRHFFGAIDAIPTIRPVALGPLTQNEIATYYSGPITVAKTPSMDSAVRAILDL